ncbi:MAG TPA: AAA family ATPase, partial [Candidatus Limnocylindrales bacterium]|nr:AAA family ATPase [Candidatus Limnocylindrales bacterium]
MSAPARLLALRLQGFKSFAERTVVEFGGGISAIVGPNGSGKSNLADALRWSLGEQGRALRSRKSEDVIFAGSDRRGALGMADVTLVLDNADGLLPVDYSVLELGRRLYRSGENDYLLNRQRVRLRDLVELLDAAHLADNAFLFIGQGMVDQALALRPEERRPLFEEVAGVRRHERRRRRAEDQLAESEANLARVEDILGELRPQARRLAAQAEQQATRLSAGEQLADALILAAHHRWHEASSRAAATVARRERERAEADRAMTELQAAEEAAAAIAAELAARADADRERRAAHETARARLTELQLRNARLAGDLEAIGRDRSRLADELAAAEADLAVQRRALAQPVPPRDLDLEAAVGESERALADALAELGALRAADRARGEEAAAIRRAEAAREAEVETALRRLADAERRATSQRQAADEAAARQADLARARTAAGAELQRAVEDERAAAAEREAAREAADAAEAARQAAAERAASIGSLLAAQRGRLEALEAHLAEEESRGIARAAKRRGGRRLDEDLVVDPALRAAVEAALDERARAYLVNRDVVRELAGERGILVPADAAQAGAPDSGRARASAPESRFLDQIADAGGAPLANAIRRDPGGAASRLLARAVVVPDLEAALALQADLPAGWLVVVRDGSAVVDAWTVRLGRSDAALERRAEADRLRSEVARLDADSAAVSTAADEAAADAASARTRFEESRAAESRAVGRRREAEESERAAARTLEAAAREAAWQAAQAETIATEVLRLAGAVAAHETGRDPSMPAGAGDVAMDPGRASALAAWEARATELRVARDRLAADQARFDAARREQEARRARAEAAVDMDGERIARA